MDEIRNQKDITDQFRRHFLQILEESKAEYIASMKAYEASRGNLPGEGWSDYNSGLTFPTGNNARGYFLKDIAYNFHGLDDFDSEKLVNYFCEFLSKPENKDREVLILDAMGQGTAAVELRAEVLKRIPSARITIIASTFKPSGNNTQGVLELNGDTLLNTFARPVFDEIYSRMASGATFLCTFFRPSSGLKTTGGRLYIQYALYERLREIFDATADDGLLFLQAPIDDTDLEFVQELLQIYGAGTLLTMGDAVALLKKDATALNASALPIVNGIRSLPSIEEIAVNHWDLLTKYWKIPKPRIRVKAGTTY